jgi:hypothetical protein
MVASLFLYRYSRCSLLCHIYNIKELPFPISFILKVTAAQKKFKFFSKRKDDETIVHYKMIKKFYILSQNR